jgi:hypothetical protein
VVLLPPPQAVSATNAANTALAMTIVAGLLAATIVSPSFIDLPAGSRHKSCREVGLQ